MHPPCDKHDKMECYDCLREAHAELQEKFVVLQSAAQKITVATAEERDLIAANLSTSQSSEARLRRALEESRDLLDAIFKGHNPSLNPFVMPANKLDVVVTEALSASPSLGSDRLAKLETVAEELLSLREQGFLENLPTIREEGIEADLNERFEPLLKALSNLAGEG